MTGWLRRCLKQHRTMVTFVASAVTVVSVAVILPSHLWLSAAQFPVPSDLSANHSGTNGSDSAMEIIPRGTDTSTGTIPFQRFSAPITASGVPKGRTATSFPTQRISNGHRTTQNATGHASRPRAVLQAPVFGASQSRSGFDAGAETAVDSATTSSKAARLNAVTGHS